MLSCGMSRGSWGIKIACRAEIFFLFCFTALQCLGCRSIGTYSTSRSSKSGVLKKAMSNNPPPVDVVVVGGFGHVGLPFGIVFASKGLRVCLYDIDIEKAKLINNGQMPFIEYGAESLLREVLDNGNLSISLDKQSIAQAKYVVIAIGTPVDEYLNPKTRAFLEVILELSDYLSDDQVIVVRSTIYPRTCEQMQKLLADRGKFCPIAYCPERIAQGYAVRELTKLPQIVSALSEDAACAATDLFAKVSPKILNVSVKEAELVKLFSNAWRYIQFAVTNQFYMIAHNFGVDYNTVRQAMREEYGRAADLPTAGFAAGPCLVKDTMQLAALYSNNFVLGHAAMMINEGLPGFIVDDLSTRYDLSQTKVGILGMAFKKDIDDIRDSLSYKLGKILRFRGSDVYYSDEYVKDPTFVEREELLRLCAVVIIGVPHSAYNDLQFPNNVEVVDLWGITRNAVLP